MDREITASRLLTAGELADRWRVKRTMVYRLAREGKIPAVRLGRYYRFDIGEIEKFEAQGGTEKETS